MKIENFEFLCFCKNFNQQIWDLNKREIVKQGNILKYDSNPNLKEILLSTKPFKLVEANGKDRVWGIGKYVGCTRQYPSANPEQQRNLWKYYIAGW